MASRSSTRDVFIFVLLVLACVVGLAAIWKVRFESHLEDREAASSKILRDRVKKARQGLKEEDMISLQALAEELNLERA